MHTLFDRLGVNIFMVSYRGYGRSGGSPEEQGLKLDAVAVMNHVSRMPQIDNKRILVLGRSLGGAVGTYIAANHPEHVKGLVLENTFTSIPDMVDVVMPWVAPLKFLVLRISWASIDLIPKVTAPVLFISGLRDELVPPEHMKRLFDAAVSPPTSPTIPLPLLRPPSSLLSTSLNLPRLPPPPLSFPLLSTSLDWPLLLGARPP